MKKLFILSLFFCSINSFSQINDLINTNWYLSHLIINEETHTAPSNEEIPYIEADFFITDIPEFQTTLCRDFLYKGLGWDHETENSQIQFWGGQWYEGLTDCGNPNFTPNNQDYKVLYFSFFNVYEDYEIFNYEISTNTNGIKFLKITNPAGYEAFYNSEVMATNDFDIDNLKVSPNPVNNKLTIQNSDAKNLIIQITNTNGKLILSQKFNSDKTEINFSNYPKGIYFVTFESEGKIIKTEKIIKK